MSTDAVRPCAARGPVAVPTRVWPCDGGRRMVEVFTLEVVLLARACVGARLVCEASPPEDVGRAVGAGRVVVVEGG